MEVSAELLGQPERAGPTSAAAQGPGVYGRSRPGTTVMSCCGGERNPQTRESSRRSRSALGGRLVFVELRQGSGSRDDEAADGDRARDRDCAPGDDGRGGDDRDRDRDEV